MSRRAAAVLILATAVAGGCQSRPPGGLEGRTLDTPEQAFAYFRDAVRLERYDLEYGVYSEEFIAENGDFSLQDYVRGRPWATGESAELLENLLEAEIEGEPELSPDRREARLVLVSKDFRAEVFLVRRTFWRLGLDELPEPIRGTLEDLEPLVTVDGDDVVLRLPAARNARRYLPPGVAPSDITRVEAAHRWYLRSIGRVERQ